MDLNRSQQDRQTRNPPAQQLRYVPMQAGAIAMPRASMQTDSVWSLGSAHSVSRPTQDQIYLTDSSTSISKSPSSSQILASPHLAHGVNYISDSTTPGGHMMQSHFSSPATPDGHITQDSFAGSSPASVIAPSFVVPKLYQNIPRHSFPSMTAARAFSALQAWRPPIQNVPRTDVAKQPYVDFLRDNMLDFSDFKDNLNMNRKKKTYANPLLNGAISIQCLEAGAVRIVDATVTLHLFGRQSTGLADTTIKDGDVLQDQRDLTFEQRIQAIGNLVKHNKQSVWDIAKGQHNLEYLCVLAPGAREAAKDSDRRRNNLKGEKPVTSKRKRSADGESEEHGATEPRPRKKAVRASHQSRSQAQAPLTTMGEEDEQEHGAVVLDDADTWTSGGASMPHGFRCSRASEDSSTTHCHPLPLRDFMPPSLATAHPSFVASAHSYLPVLGHGSSSQQRSHSRLLGEDHSSTLGRRPYPEVQAASNRAMAANQQMSYAPSYSNNAHPGHTANALHEGLSQYPSSFTSGYQTISASTQQQSWSAQFTADIPSGLPTAEELWKSILANVPTSFISSSADADTSGRAGSEQAPATTGRAQNLVDHNGDVRGEVSFGHSHGGQLHVHNPFVTAYHNQMQYGPVQHHDGDDQLQQNRQHGQ